MTAVQRVEARAAERRRLLGEERGGGKHDAPALDGDRPTNDPHWRRPRKGDPPQWEPAAEADNQPVNNHWDRTAAPPEVAAPLASGGGARTAAERSADAVRVHFLLHEAHALRLLQWKDHNVGSRVTEARPTGLARINHAFRVVAELRRLSDEGEADWDCSSDDDKASVRRLFIAVQESAHHLSPDRLRLTMNAFTHASTFALAEACDVDVDRVLSSLNYAARHTLFKNWFYGKAPFSETNFGVAADVISAWSSMADAGARIVHPPESVTQVNRVAGDFADQQLRVKEVAAHLEAEPLARQRAVHRLSGMIDSWYRMSEVHDAFPLEAAHMLVGPYDLAPAAEAYQALTARDSFPADVGEDPARDAEELAIAVKTLSLFGKVLGGYLSFTYKEMYLNSEKLHARGHNTRAGFPRLRGVVQDATRRMVALQQHMSAEEVAEVNAALGSMIMSGTVIDRPTDQPTDAPALGAVSRAARRLAPEMSADAVAAAMLGWKRIKARSAAGGCGEDSDDDDGMRIVRMGSRGNSHNVRGATTWERERDVSRRDYEAVMDRAGAVADTMTPAQVARVIRCWGDMVEVKKKTKKQRKANDDGVRRYTTKYDRQTDDRDESEEEEEEGSKDAAAADDDAEWAAPSRESLQTRLDVLSAAAARAAPSMDRADFKNLLQGWAALAQHHPAGLTLDAAAVAAVTSQAPRVCPDIPWQHTTAAVARAMDALQQIEGIEIAPEARAAVDDAMALASRRSKAELISSEFHALGLKAEKGWELDAEEVAAAAAAAAAVGLYKLNSVYP
jgi:hypothetical protein